MHNPAIRRPLCNSRRDRRTQRATRARNQAQVRMTIFHSVRVDPVADIVRLAGHDDDVLLALGERPDEGRFCGLVESAGAVDAALLHVAVAEDGANLAFIAFDDVEVAFVQEGLDGLTPDGGCSGAERGVSNVEMVDGDGRRTQRDQR